MKKMISRRNFLKVAGASAAALGLAACGKRSSWERIEAFADIVHKAGYASPIRTPRGEDIMAACGQLKSASERGRKSAAQIAAEARA